MNEWIKCSERLPNRQSHYLVTRVRYDEEIEGKEYRSIDWVFFNMIHKVWDNKYFTMPIIAWKENDEPYEGEP